MYVKLLHIHASETLSLKKQVGCFNHGVGTLVASKLKRQRLWEVYCIRDYNHKATKETAALIILQPSSCMLIVTTNICKGITCLYKNHESSLQQL